METKWFFELASLYTPFLDLLTDQLGRENTGFNIIKIEDDIGSYYQFTSDYVDQLAEPIDAYDATLQLIQLLNGILFLTHEEPPIIRTTGDFFDANHQRVIIPTKGQRSFVFGVITYVNSEISSPEKSVALLLELAKKDDHLRDLLFILGEPVSYRQLILALETTRSLLNSQSSFKQLTGSELYNKLALLERVANNYSTIGTAARHRNPGITPPSTTIELEEAEVLIRNAVVLVIKERFNIELPLFKKISFTAEDLF